MQISKLAHNLIKQGNIRIFYVKKKGSKNSGDKFVGVPRVTSEWYREEKHLWFDETKEDRAKYPWRAKLEPIKIDIADFESLIPRLEFIKREERPKVHLVGTSANLRRPIPELDAREIIDTLS